MPQFNFATFVPQIFWLIVSFLLMLILMKCIIVPRLSGIAEARKHYIENYIKKAEKLQEEAEDSLKRYNEIISTAKESADKQMQQAKAELDILIKEQTSQATQNLSAKIQENEHMLEEQRQEAHNLALEAAEKISLTALHQLGFVDKTLDDVQKISRFEEREEQ